MSNILDMVQTDSEAEDVGVWVDLFGTKFRVRALGSPEVQKVTQRLGKKYQRVRDANDGNLPPELLDEEGGLQVASIVTGWENMPDPDRKGEMLAYSHEAAVALFSRRDLRRLRTLLFSESARQDNFRKEAVKQMEGNSETPSNGASASAKTRKV